jgi:hypothetical protein
MSKESEFANDAILGEVWIIKLEIKVLICADDILNSAEARQQLWRIGDSRGSTRIKAASEDRALIQSFVFKMECVLISRTGVINNKVSLRPTHK